MIFDLIFRLNGDLKMRIHNRISEEFFLKFMHFMLNSGMVEWSDRLYSPVFYWLRQWGVPPVPTAEERVTVTGTSQQTLLTIIYLNCL